MSTYNYRLAQTSEQSNPGFSFNYQNQTNQVPQQNAQQVPQQTTQPMAGTNPQQASAEQGQNQANVIETLDTKTKEVKQFVTNHFRVLITANNIAADAVEYKWIQRFFNYIGVKFNFQNFIVDLLENRIDKIINQTAFGKIISDQQLRTVFRNLRTDLLNKIPKIDEFRAIYRRVQEIKSLKSHFSLGSYKNLDTIIDNMDNLDDARKAKVQPLLSRLLAYKKALDSSTNAEQTQNILKQIDAFLLENKENYYLKLLTENNKDLAKSVNNFSKTVAKDANALEPVAKNMRLLGDNPTEARKMAVKSFDLMANIFRKVEFLKPLISFGDFLAGPNFGRNLMILDTILSSADALQWIIELSTGAAKLDFSVNVMDDREQYKKNLYFVISMSKLLTSILQWFPPITVFVAPIDALLGILQNDAVMDKVIDTGIELGVAAGGMGWGGAQKIKEVERINEQAYGTPPSNPDVKIVYDWILQNADVGKLIFQDVNRLKQMRLSESQKYTDMAIEYFKKNAPKDVWEKANAGGMLNTRLRSWLNNETDTRFMELRNSLLAVCSNIIKDAVQEVKQPTQPNNNNQQQPTANRVYNNRRYVTCPSI
jgi:hypothetical protein